MFKRSFSGRLTRVKRTSTIAIINSTNALGLELISQLLQYSPLSGQTEPAQIKAIVSPIYNARDIDSLNYLQEKHSLASSSNHCEIYEVDPLIAHSYDKILQDCDYVSCCLSLFS
jgi:hypothetical protein